MLFQIKYDKSHNSYEAMNSDLVETKLTTDAIHGSKLSMPFSKHTAADLCWQLLCRGIKVPTSWNKSLGELAFFYLIYL